MLKKYIFLLLAFVPWGVYAQTCSGSYTLNVTLSMTSPITLGQNGTTISADTSGFVEYYWYINDSLTSLSNADTMDIGDLPYGDYDITLMATNANGCQIQSDTLHVILSDIADLNISDDIKIYPNPSEKYITIEGKSLVKGTVGIYTLDGKELQKFILDSCDKNKLDISILPKGIYILRYKNGFKTANLRFTKI